MVLPETVSYLYMNENAFIFQYKKYSSNIYQSAAYAQMPLETQLILVVLVLRSRHTY